jgi:hypothetical protein
MWMPFRFASKWLARFLSKPRPRQSHLPTTRFARLEACVRPGDVILVEGTSRFATAIKYLSQSTWSHAALYIGDAHGGHDDEGRLLDMVDVDVNEGVRLFPLREFSGMHTRICRPVGLGEAEIAEVIDYMVSRVGHGYDLRNIFDLMRFLIRTPPVPGSMRRKLLALGSGAPTKAICSTLLAQAFQSVRYPILPEIEIMETRSASGRAAVQEILHIRHHSLYVPRDFDVSPFFRIVKPRLESNFDYRELTWRVSEHEKPQRDI